jgi:periplasmic protein TonB
MDNSLRDITDFDDILFETRNKEYGAYYLRKRYNGVVVGSLILSIIIGCAAVLIPYYRIPAKKSKEVVYSVRYVTIENMRRPDEQFIPPEVPLPAPPSPTQVRAVIKYVAPEVVDSIMPLENVQIPTTDLILMEGKDQGIGGGNINGGGNDIGVLSDFEGGGGGNEPFIIVEVMPTFRGGDINIFREWVQKRTTYPKMASDNGIQGKVYLTFIVEADGSVTNVKVAQGVDPLLDNEALKAVMSSPKWTPGRQRGEPVRVRFSINLNFQL